MTPFGYKMGWLAIRSTDKNLILAALGLTIIKEIIWDKGIDTIYSEGKDNVIFITPAVNDWTFIIGLWALGTGEEDSVHNIENLITKLSTQFDEVQAFATHRVIEYHHWMLAQKGQLVRAFAYLGESAEVLTDTGELTQIEQPYKWDQLEECLWTPDEETVLEVAGAWSINPTEIEELTIEGMGILAQAPVI
jgi:hypothetical protein